MTLLVLFIVVILSVIQVPLDLRSHLLSRRATLVSMVAIALLIGMHSLLSGRDDRAVIAVVLSVLVVCTYGLLHKVSDGALGQGDVLLVAPLGLAIAYVDKSALISWQLFATLSASVHAIVLKVKSGNSSIPFGPHLLIASLVILIGSL